MPFSKISSSSVVPARSVIPDVLLLVLALVLMGTGCVLGFREPGMAVHWSEWMTWKPWLEWGAAVAFCGLNGLSRALTWHVQLRSFQVSSHLSLSLIAALRDFAASQLLFGFRLPGFSRQRTHHRCTGLAIPAVHAARHSSNLIHLFRGLALVSRFVVCLLLLHAVGPHEISNIAWIFTALVLALIHEVLRPGLAPGFQLVFLGVAWNFLDLIYPWSHALMFAALAWLADSILAAVLLIALRDPVSARKGHSPRTELKSISVVIPAKNEELELPETLRRLRGVPEILEIIVVDGGSEDATVAKATQAGCQVLVAGGGRGGQMRAGAACARGDVVLLVHADTWLNPDAGQAILRALRDPRVACGGLWKQFRHPPFLLRGSRPKCAIRVLIGRRLVGDMAMFLPRRTLEEMGGIPDMELMEDFAMSAMALKSGCLALADSTVSTSARRFRERGVVSGYLRMWRVARSYRAGKHPRELKVLYEKD